MCSMAAAITPQVHRPGRAVSRAHPDLKGFFGANEGSIIGVLNAVTELGRDDLVVISYDSE